MARLGRLIVPPSLMLTNDSNQWCSDFRQIFRNISTFYSVEYFHYIVKLSLNRWLDWGGLLSRLHSCWPMIPPLLKPHYDSELKSLIFNFTHQKWIPAKDNFQIWCTMYSVTAVTAVSLYYSLQTIPQRLSINPRMYFPELLWSWAYPEMIISVCLIRRYSMCI